MHESAAEARRESPVCGRLNCRLFPLSGLEPESDHLPASGYCPFPPAPRTAGMKECMFM